MAAAAAEKVFVALPAEFKAGQSTLSWALSNFGGGESTIVITHVHVPSQMIPFAHFCFLLGPRFASVKSFNQKKMSDRPPIFCKFQVKCKKLIFENEDVIVGLIDLIALHGVSKLVISAAADRQYSRKMGKPKSRIAIEIMQRADPSCKIWFVCKGELICIRDKDVEIAPAGSPLVPHFDRPTLQLSTHHEEEYVQEEGDFVLELGLYAEIEEACVAAESLMRRALNESSRRQKADEELVSVLQKAKEYEELYLEEVRKREQIEAALARANQEIAQLREVNSQVKDEQDTTTTAELQEEMEMAETSIAERQLVVYMNTDLVLGTAAGQVIGPQEEKYIQVKVGRDDSTKELQALLDRSKQAMAFSPSSVIQSPYDEDCAPSYFLCPILQEVMRDPQIAADGFTYEAGAIRGWLEAGREVSPVTGQPLAHRELSPNLALRGVIQDYMIRRRRQHHRF
ncbi:hypothetical protein PR202_gb07380 [Eleusine coracana subsp. coracana]|uniref:RING-type E3 ubiquitin transferase n=1 Tax=Eleusine coracana subsp. coracana TaxID=191504 RepID=A0AAV5E9J6_ELECO|nr:hypothetical protein PR202_gb07380 [Eleusine coracana subsp. coracana]